MTAGRPGRGRSEASWRAILEATRDELESRGYDRLSLDRIAAAAGVGKQTIYRWYPSKSALVAECILRGYVLTPAIVPADTGDARRDITTWVRAFAEGSEEPGAAALIRAGTAAAAEDAEISARYRDQVTRITEESLAARLRIGIDAGQLTPETPVDAVVDAIVGALLYRILTRQSVTAEFVDALVDVVFTGIENSAA